MSNEILTKTNSYADEATFVAAAATAGVILEPCGRRYTTDGRLAARVYRVYAETERSKAALANFAGSHRLLLGNTIRVTGVGRRRAYTVRESEFTLTVPTYAYIYLTDKQKLEQRAESATIELKLKYGVGS